MEYERTALSRLLMSRIEQELFQFHRLWKLVIGGSTAVPLVSLLSVEECKAGGNRKEVIKRHVLVGREKRCGGWKLCQNRPLRGHLKQLLPYACSTRKCALRDMLFLMLENRTLLSHDSKVEGLNFAKKKSEDLQSARKQFCERPMIEIT